MQGIGAQPVLNVAQKPVPRQAGCRRQGINAYVEMVALGKDPCVSIADGGKIEGKITLLPRYRCLDLQSKALGKPGADRAQQPNLAACAIGADQKARPIVGAGG